MWSRFWRLSLRERRLLMLAFVLLPIAAIRLRLRGAASLRQDAAPPPPANVSEPPVVGEAARMVKAAAYYTPLPVTCLPQSMVLQQLLRREGVETELRIGVRKAGGALDAHAWVEYQGRPVNDPSVVRERFTVLHADSRS